MTTTPASAAPVPTLASPTPRPAPSRRRAVGVNAIAYLVLLVGLFAFTDLHASWTFDDGAYATQVKVLNETGNWAYPYRWADRDPTSRFAPVSHSVETTDATYPYVKRPVWIRILQASTKLFGTPLGLFVPSLLGAWAAALTAWALAERLEAGRGPLGFWAAALGPIVVHSSAMWAHTGAVALGGVMAIILVDAHRGRRARWHLPVALATTISLVSLRTDGLIAVLAFSAALALTSREGGRGGVLARRRAPGHKRGSLAGLWGAGLVTATAAVTYVGTGAWAHHIASGTWQPSRDVILTGLGFVPSRWSGFVCTFVTGGLGDANGAALAWLSVGCWLIAGVLLARRAALRMTAGFALVGLAVLGLRMYAVARFDLAGALLALPLVTVALGCLLGSTRSRPRTITSGTILGVYIGVHLALVVATQYPEGGSIDWGGRFLFPVLVPATVLSALAVARRLHDGAALSVRNATIVTLVVLVAVPTSVGWLSARDLRSVMGQTAARLDAPEGTTVIRLDRSGTRGSWTLLPERDILSAEQKTAPVALAMLRPGRTRPVLVIGGGADRVRAPGYRRTVIAKDEVSFLPV